MMDSYAHRFKEAHDFVLAKAPGLNEGGPDTAALRRATAQVVMKALSALNASDRDRYSTSGGTVRVKTKPRSQAERAKLDALLNVLADWPFQPFGATTSAVEETLRRHAYPLVEPDAVWSTAVHSLSSRRGDC